MKTLLLFFFVLIHYASLRAQDSTLVTVKAGSRISEVLQAGQIYLHPRFISGSVYFRNDTRATALMNYNSLYDQMLFIGSKGDTLALKDENTIRFIALDKDTFYYDEGYIRLVAGNSVLRLAERRVWEVADIRKMGSHDRQAKTFAVTTMRTYTDGFGDTRDLVLNEDLVLRKRATYYFGDPYNHFVPASKKHLLLLFPKEHTSLTAYLKENKVSFDKMADLDKLARLLEQKR